MDVIRGTCGTIDTPGVRTLIVLDRHKQLAEWKARGRAARERMRDKRGG